MKKKYYPSINGLRALSIMLVILSHLFSHYEIFKQIPDKIWLRPLTQFFKDGQLGVNVFFVISGFLITSLMLDEEEETKTISLKKFYMRRTLRIFPAYFFLLLVYAVLQSFDYFFINKEAWISALTYTKYFNWQQDWYTAHAWSLSVEEHFYLLWPLLFLGGASFRKVMAFAMVLLVPIMRVYAHYYPVEWINELTIFFRIDSIATGCLFALYKDKIIAYISPYWHAVFIVSLVGIFFVRYVYNIADILHIVWITIPLGIPQGEMGNVLIALLLMYSVFGPQKTWFRFLNLKVINYIGLLSYSIYLWQQLFTPGPLHWQTDFPQNMFFILTIAMFSYHCIEKPFLKLKSKFAF